MNQTLKMSGTTYHAAEL